ncbi:MAG: lipopolysaccharide kinase InaA family protein [Gemmatimonadota bacterium]|nr:lipopolysaccharide kinase InaA family protein [Gemmatimonadota bacterium]
MLPAGYEAIQGCGIRGFAWGPARDRIERALLDHGSLRRWASALGSGEPLSGRGTVIAIDAPAPGPDGHGRWAVRRYLRGGQVARLMGDRYLKGGQPRPVRELRASCTCRERGVPTPAVVAGTVYPTGPLHYRADLVTELLPDSADLAAVLFGSPGAAPRPDPTAALEATGFLLVRAASRGIRHVDLNAKNVVLTSSEAGVTAHLIDLDRCRVRARPLEEADASAMRRRLTRSLRKHAARTGRALDDALWRALERGMERESASLPPESDPDDRG